MRRFFADWFHCLDAFVILASFIVDVLSHGVLEEIASLVIILRLFRFVKIVEELSVGAAERVSDPRSPIAQLHAPRLTYGLLCRSKTSKPSSKGWSVKTPTSRLRSKLFETRVRRHSNERVITPRGCSPSRIDQLERALRVSRYDHCNARCFTAPAYKVDGGRMIV